jgi:hypothetical protein
VETPWVQIIRELVFRKGLSASAGYYGVTKGRSSKGVIGAPPMVTRNRKRAKGHMPLAVDAILSADLSRRRGRLLLASAFLPDRRLGRRFLTQGVG